MPATRVHFFKDESGAPVLAWLEELKRHNRRAYVRCVASLNRLRELGHELRRPTADYLRDGIYELRVHEGRIQYRMLYCFQGRNVALLTHATTKEGRVDPNDIELALRRKRAFEADPKAHLYEEDEDAP